MKTIYIQVKKLRIAGNILDKKEKHRRQKVTE
jgi:hypothetical protein